MKLKLLSALCYWRWDEFGPEYPRLMKFTLFLGLDPVPRDDDRDLEALLPDIPVPVLATVVKDVEVFSEGCIQSIGELVESVLCDRLIPQKIVRMYLVISELDRRYLPALVNLCFRIQYYLRVSTNRRFVFVFII